MRRIRTRIGALGVALLATVPLSLTAPAAAAAPADVTVEEGRLTQAAPQEILRRSGFGAVDREFGRGLARVTTYEQARRYVADEGRALWRRAVDRAQGRGPDGGDLSRDDDRPLYWARLGMTKQLRQWKPDFALTESARRALLGSLERGSRGQDSIELPAGKHILRIVVTGFDPFQLDADARRSNPSGAAALALDGTTVRTASGQPARIETAVFPVRWADFADGTVERTLLPHFRSGPRQADLFTTVSQGRPGRFDVERTNGAWRGGYPDNARDSRTETVPIPAGVPTVRPQPQWTTTSLPYARIVAAGTGPFPVADHTEVTEIPAGGTGPVVRPDGPTPGSTARAGGGGDYLSNEIAYRATLLRDAVRPALPGGHLHTPVLEFGPGNTGPANGQVTDPVFVQNRVAITGQVRAIVTVAAAQVAAARGARG
ncbi:pyroglutamyl peptidase [Streptomyces decoyicus]|uniref:pyroglutamyl peptidase n=1 Tax=Streptomyces decoyicus TaxID=249567 RepID=UPI00069E6C41|nr:pyroglutamyl peptidase [Streptomyces decoyicus]KOG48208.1 pyroglutamyl peptidase [Streptomyces decoyicus]QZY15850.1 pyroglutamyl peptidase [Streptomyces decoyicus]